MAIQQTRRALAPDRARGAEGGVSAQSRTQRAVISRQYGAARRQARAANGTGERLATALGWFSIGLGVAEIVAPRSLAKLIGVRDKHTLLLRTLGMREVASGIGILTQRRPTGWLWSRVAGDAMDLSLLVAALNSKKSDRARVTAATAAVAGVTVLDAVCAQRLSDDYRADGSIARERSITINRPPEELYRFWRDFRNLPRFMDHLESVQEMGENRSRWTAKAPAGMTVEWEAEIVEDRPGELIAWRSLERADVENSGSVQFTPAPGGRGTEVRVMLEYKPPAGMVGAAIAKLFGEEPEQQLQGDLYRFKQVMETGDVVRSDASIHRGPHPARPAGD